MSVVADLKILRSQNIWNEHKDFPLEDWQYEVANGDTRLGYWEWAIAQAENHQDPDMEHEEDHHRKLPYEMTFTVPIGGSPFLPDGTKANYKYQTEVFYARTSKKATRKVLKKYPHAIVVSSQTLTD
jgi:hypothetical protein